MQTWRLQLLIWDGLISKNVLFWVLGRPGTVPPLGTKYAFAE